MKIAVIAAIVVGVYLAVVEVLVPLMCDWLEEAMFSGPVMQNEPPTGR